jgi:hypothetical protein
MFLIGIIGWKPMLQKSRAREDEFHSAMQTKASTAVNGGGSKVAGQSS